MWPRTEPLVPSCKSLPSRSIAERIMSLGAPHRGTMSPGRSERKVACCERCSATLVALKKQALSLAVHHHFSCKDSGDLSGFLHDNLRVLSRSTPEFRDREREQGDCGACGTHLDQLKEEAVHMALSRGQSTATLPGGYSDTKHAERAQREAATYGHQPHGWTHSPQTPRSPRTPQRTPQTLRRRKLNTGDMGRWVEEQQQLAASSAKTVSNADGVTFHPHHQQTTHGSLMSCGDAGIVQTSSKIPHISRVVTIANSAAMSFLARAAEKLNLTSRKKGQNCDPAPANLSTCFREIIQKTPPAVPSCLLQAATRTKDSPSVGKVKVVLRVHPTSLEDYGQPPVLRVDLDQKRVTVMEPACQSQPQTTMTLGRERKNPLKTFNFDAAYPQESSQAEVCAGVLADVIRCVLSGSDGCVLGLGCADVGSWSSMVGNDESIQKLGLIPCAISWLYSAIERRREKTWTDLTVSVSAIELCCGEEDTLRDLLGEVGPSSGSAQDSPRAHVKLQEDPVYGIQLRNHNRVKAPTAERAASLLDAAITARRHNDFTTFLSHSSIMFFTLHVQPPRTESSTIGKGCRGPTKLTMVDVCSGMWSGTGYGVSKPPHSELGPVVLSILSGNKTIPKKGSKLTMLLREALGHVKCHTAVVAQVANSMAHLQETFSTIQLASRIRRTQRRTKQSTSCSPCGRSLTKEKRGPQSSSLRAFHSTDEVDVDVCHFRLRGELDERSSSDQSCDTVIQIDSDGFIQARAASRLTQPEFVPIIPSLDPRKADMDDPEFTALLQELLRIPQLHVDNKKEDVVQGHLETLRAEIKQPERDSFKCDTFAELQERLGCIDGSETTADILKSSSKGLSDNVTTKSQPSTKPGRHGDAASSQVSESLVNKCSGRTQTSAGEKQTDGASPGESFQREDSGLYDCEECSGTSSSEELLNQTLGLNSTCCVDVPKSGTLKSCEKLSSRIMNVDTLAKAANSSPDVAHPLPEKQEAQAAADWFKPDKRTSPIGKSSPISPTSSCSPSHSSSTGGILGDVLANKPKEDLKEVKATITVTVQQPLDLKGQDELVFSMVEEVTINGALNSSRTGGNIICFRDNAQSPTHIQGSASSQPIRIISNISDEPAAEDGTKDFSTQPEANDTGTINPQYQLRREMRLLPSFINPMLMNTETHCDLEGIEEKENTHHSKSLSHLKGNNVKCEEETKGSEKKSGAFASKANVRKPDKMWNLSFSQDSFILEDQAVCDATAENRMSGKRPRNADKSHLGDGEHVCSSNTPRGLSEAEMACQRIGNNRIIGVSVGCQETASASFHTGSLPRGWQGASHRPVRHGGPIADDHRHPRGVTSSTPCSPGVTLEKRQGRQCSPVNHSLCVSSSLKYGTEYRQEASNAPRKGVGSLFETSSMKHDPMTSSNEDSSRLFNVKLEQLTSRTNSLGRTPRDYPSFDNTSMTSKANFKGTFEGASRGAHKGRSEGDCTLPRGSRSSRKNHPTDEYQPARPAYSKLSAVGKLKISSPKVRRLSVPSIKNLSLPHKGLQQSINRSASLSPDSKTVSFERTSSFLSSSPPRSFHSISRTPSQSSSCSSTKSAIQGFVNGRISDLLKERATSPTSGGLEQAAMLPSPYSRVTSPRVPSHMSGHASDTTSVLSGDLPPAMGKTSLHFSNRNSTMSSGYDSMVRDSEATGSSASNRDSVSDRSGSLLSVARSSRSSRRRGNTGAHQRRLSHDAPAAMRRSSSGLRTRCVDRGIPEAYEIKVYEIDNVQRMQKRAGAGKQGPPCFSAKLKFLEHRQQRVSEVRAKYNTLRGELERAKQNLMLKPATWNKEFDLWQTFEVDPLEHLEALEVVTAQLEKKVDVCKANVMTVTCFDAAARRRRRQRRVPVYS